MLCLKMSYKCRQSVYHLFWQKMPSVRQTSNMWKLNESRWLIDTIYNNKMDIHCFHLWMMVLSRQTQQPQCHKLIWTVLIWWKSSTDWVHLCSDLWQEEERFAKESMVLPTDQVSLLAHQLRSISSSSSSPLQSKSFIKVWGSN